MIIGLDPGHGGQDMGAVREWARESDLAHDMALRVRAQAIAAGHDVVLLRDNESGPTLEERANLAVEKNCRFVISIHFNACLDAPSKYQHGAEVYHFPGADLPRDAGGEIIKAMPVDLHKRDAEYRNVFQTKPWPHWKGKAHSVLRWHKVPALLVECCYLTDHRNRAYLRIKDNRDIIATAILAGINYLAQQIGEVNG